MDIIRLNLAWNIRRIIPIIKSLFVEFDILVVVLARKWVWPTYWRQRGWGLINILSDHKVGPLGGPLRSTVISKVEIMFSKLSCLHAKPSLYSS